MDTNTWIMFFVGIAITCGLFALGVVLYPKLKNDRPTNPVEAEIEAALLPFIFQGICAAYRLSEQSVDDLNKRITGLDKKRVADSIYAMLPDKVNNFDLSLVKHVVTQQRFEQLVQDGFNRFYRFYVEHQAHFDQMFEEWKKVNAPESATAVPAVPAPAVPTPAEPAAAPAIAG